MTKPIVALVGRPNVGKSTLFNRLAGERLAVVDARPGTTRDRLTAESEWNGIIFDIVDTGGIDPTNLSRETPLSEDSADFIPQIKAQAEIAVLEADAILFLVDLESGVTPADHEVADILRRLQRNEGGEMVPPILLVVNRAESAKRLPGVAEFYEMGMGEPLPISALHGTGTGDLLDELIRVLDRPLVPEAEEAEGVHIAIVGRPNVGKSSLVNRLLGQERIIVSPIAGTTRDAIDTRLRFHGMDITLIDTAGIRRRGRIVPGVEKYSVLRALRAIERASVVLLMIDATEGVTAQDTHIGGMVLEKLRSVVVLVNKWDLIEKDTHTMAAFEARIREALNFLDYVPVLFISAKTGQRVNQILDMAIQVEAERSRRISTGELNRLLQRALEAHAPPTRSGKRLKIKYVSQVAIDPPTFLFHVNEPKLVHFTYERYLENRIRAEYGFLGTPLRLSFRRRG
jgi:GTP-binding protein